MEEKPDVELIGVVLLLSGCGTHRRGAPVDWVWSSSAWCYCCLDVDASARCYGCLVFLTPDNDMVHDRKMFHRKTERNRKKRMKKEQEEEREKKKKEDKKENKE